MTTLGSPQAAAISLLSLCAPSHPQFLLSPLCSCPAGDAQDLRKRKRLGQDNIWLSPSSTSATRNREERGWESPRTLTDVGSLTPPRRREQGESGLGRDLEQMTWRRPGPVTLHPGVNEIEVSADCLPPPGHYIFESLSLHWGHLTLEQEQLSLLDSDTQESLSKNRPPPRRFSALSHAPQRKALTLQVLARPPLAHLSILCHPILPPDAHHLHQVSVSLDTRSDVLHEARLKLRQTPCLLVAGAEARLVLYTREKGKRETEVGGEVRREGGNVHTEMYRELYAYLCGNICVSISRGRVHGGAEIYIPKYRYMCIFIYTCVCVYAYLYIYI